MVHRVTEDAARRPYHLYVPSAGGEGAPMFVAVHGLSRNVEEHARLFSGHCEANRAVLVAPLFAESHAADYQRLGRAGRGPRADALLDAVVGEVSRLTGARAWPFHLFGFSGGAQFAHRYTMAHPHRVAHAVFAAAGWYTFPDPRERYPYGIRRTHDLPGVRFDPEEFLRVPMTVVIGDHDLAGEHMRDSPRLQRQQGRTRLERARKWVAAMRAAAQSYHIDSRVALDVIPGGDHSFLTLMQAHRLGERTFAALFGEGRRSVARNGNA